MTSIKKKSVENLYGCLLESTVKSKFLVQRLKETSNPDNPDLHEKIFNKKHQQYQQNDSDYSYTCIQSLTITHTFNKSQQHNYTQKRINVRHDAPYKKSYFGSKTASKIKSVAIDCITGGVKKHKSKKHKKHKKSKKHRSKKSKNSNIHDKHNTHDKHKDNNKKHKIKIKQLFTNS